MSLSNEFALIAVTVGGPPYTVVARGESQLSSDIGSYIGMQIGRFHGLSFSDAARRALVCASMSNDGAGL